MMQDLDFAVEELEELEAPISSGWWFSAGIIVGGLLVT